MQILIQSKKENLEKHIQNLKKSEKENKNIIKNYLENYINFIQQKNNQNKSASKNIYLIIKIEVKEEINNLEENIIQELSERYFKIKENLSRCGNVVSECSKEETIKILFSFFNSKKFLENNKGGI